MNLLEQTRCRNHPDREAVARCTGCSAFFCRECITDHKDRLLCSHCLGAATAGDHDAPPIQRRSQTPARIAIALRCLVSLAALWLIFYLLGRLLLAVPHEYHEGTAWLLYE